MYTMAFDFLHFWGISRIFFQSKFRIGLDVRVYRVVESCNQRLSMYAHSSFWYEPYKNREKHYDLDFKNLWFQHCTKFLKTREYSRKLVTLNVICFDNIVVLHVWKIVLLFADFKEVYSKHVLNTINCLCELCPKTS